MSEESQGLSLDKWIEIIESVRAKIDKLPCKDRLDVCASMTKCVDAVRNSSTGWLTWLTAPTTMNEFSEDELSEFFKQICDISRKFLDLDLYASRLLFSKLEKGKEKNGETRGVV